MALKDLIWDYNVMVVFNDDELRDSVPEMLYALGFQNVRAFDNPEDALAAVGAFHPDLMVIGALMAPINGLAFARKVRTMAGSHDPFTPIIMITAANKQEVVLRARDAGIDEFMTRPATVQALETRIRSILEKPRDPVVSEKFVGPDRRRRDKPFDGKDRRDD